MRRDRELHDAPAVMASTGNTYRIWDRIVGTAKKSTDTKFFR
jgi:hypothetical protein